MKLYTHIIIFLLIFTVSFKLFAEGEKLSPMAEVCIITCSPGEELYSVFGHSAFRVVDPMNNIDFCYNYGTFDFGVPDFYLKFARGQLDYMLSVEHFKNFKQSYIEEQRSVTEQVLDLTHPEKQKLFDLLETNAKPENKYYKYDFFNDNCATRMRDLVQKALNNKINFPDLKGDKKLTFRDLFVPYMPHHKWGEFGIVVIQGLPTDRIARSDQYVFLPDQLFKAFEGAKRKISNKLLVKTTNVIYKAAPLADTTTTITPNIAFWGLFVLVVVFSSLIWKKNPKRYWFDFFYFSIFGLLGILFLLMWFATDHKTTPWNLNMLWAIPTHVVFAAFLLKKNKPRLLSFYFLGTSILAIILVIAFKALPQGFNISTIPIILTLAIRSFVIFWKENRD